MMIVWMWWVAAACRRVIMLAGCHINLFLYPVIRYARCLLLFCWQSQHTQQNEWIIVTNCTVIKFCLIIKFLSTAWGKSGLSVDFFKYNNWNIQVLKIKILKYFSHMNLYFQSALLCINQYKNTSNVVYLNNMYNM